jgi:hypothetical protein
MLFPENKEVFLLKKSEKILKTKLRGAVLLLVMTVMFMLMIMLMATLAVVSSTNKKAYVKFEENQAYYSAASALEVFWGGAAGKGFLQDSNFYAIDPATGVPKTYYDYEYNPATGTGSVTTGDMTQGRDLELELYKLATIDGLGIPDAQLMGKIATANPSDLTKYISAVTDYHAFSTDMNFGSQFTQTLASPPTELAFYVEFPEVENAYTAGSDSYGRYADDNPDYTAGAGKPPQLATIKMEVLERYYDLAGVDREQLVAYLNEYPDDGDLTTNPIPGALSDGDPTNPKIDLTKLQNALLAGDRAEDYFKIRVTSESVLMGVKGSAAVEISTIKPVVTVPATDTAIKSFGFTEDLGSGYNATGGASGLADVKMSKSGIAGMVYSEGNVKFDSTGNLTAEDSERSVTATSGDYIESKPHVFSKSWIIFYNDQTVNAQADELYIYGSRGIYFKSNIPALTPATARMNLISNGIVKFDQGGTIPGNIVTRQFGQPGTFNKDTLVTVEGTVYAHDFYLQGTDTSGVNALTINDTKNFVIQDGTLYITDLYLNIPASAVTGDPDTDYPDADFTNGFISGKQNNTISTFGTYDKNATNPSPIKVQDTGSGDDNVKWIVKVNFPGVQDIVMSGDIYLRNYVSNDPALDTYTAKNWAQITNNNNNYQDDWIWFINVSNGPNTDPRPLYTPSSPTQSVCTYHDASPDFASSYYEFDTDRIMNMYNVAATRHITYAPANDPSYGVDEQQYAWALNTDVSHAKHPSPIMGGGSVLYNAETSPQITTPVADAGAAGYSFDTETGIVYMQMPFKVSRGGSWKKLILRFDTAQSLYKSYFKDTAQFNISTQPDDKNGDGYLTWDPSDVNPDVVGYGSLLNKYIGAYDFTPATNTYVLEDLDQAQQMNGTQNFGYILDHMVGSSQIGITDLINDSKTKVGATSWDVPGIAFDETMVPSSPEVDMPPTLTINFPSVPASPGGPVGPAYHRTAVITNDGIAKMVPVAGVFQNVVNQKSVVVAVDAQTAGRTIVLEPNASNKIIGTYLVDGNEPTNFIIKENLGNVSLGDSSTETFNIISSKHEPNFAMSFQDVGQKTGSLWHYVAKTNSIGQGTKLEAGSNAANPSSASYITLYVGKGTNITLEAGIIDGTIYAPHSGVDFGADQSPSLSPNFNDQATAAKPVAVLGTIVCGKIAFENNQTVVFLPTASGDDVTPGLPHFGWSPLVYTANAAGS